ncbi:MAG: hypothetical protein ACLQLG_19780 [Thermoguttaceae bacterium]
MYAPSLTEAVCSAVLTAHTVCQAGEWSGPGFSWGDLAIQLAGLDAWLLRTNALSDRVAELRAVHNTAPEPIGGEDAASYHEMGRTLARNLCMAVRFAVKPLCALEPAWEPMPDAADLEAHSPGVLAILRENAPRFNGYRRLMALIENEAARAAKEAAAGGSPADSPGTTGDLIERLLAGSDNVRLSDNDNAFLCAFLHQPGNRPTCMQLAGRERDPLAKLRLIRDFNRNLKGALAPPAPDQANGNAGSTPPTAKPEQGEGNDKAAADKEISELESKTPPLDRGSGKWVNNKRAADLEGVGTRTLADYRTQGIKNTAGTFGRDKDGRIWRREGTPRSHPWYLRLTLRAK